MKLSIWERYTRAQTLAAMFNVILPCTPLTTPPRSEEEALQGVLIWSSWCDKAEDTLRENHIEVD